MNYIKVGDEVVCIFPSKEGSGPDCRVGSRFFVKAIRTANSACNSRNKYYGKILVFDIHPYFDAVHGTKNVGAQIWRFAKLQGIEDYSLKHEYSLIKENA